MLAHTVAGEPIVLDSDSSSEHGDDNLDNTHAIRTVGGEQLDHDTLDLDMLATPFNCSAEKVEDGDNDDGDNDIDNNMSPRPPALLRALPPVAPKARRGLCLRGVAAPSFRQALPSCLYIHRRGVVRVHVRPAGGQRHRPKRGLSSPPVTGYHHPRLGCCQGAAAPREAAED
jgi:hypothetical protein